MIQTLAGRAPRIPESAWIGISSAFTGYTLRFPQSVFTPVLEQSGVRGYHVVFNNQSYVEVPPAVDMPAEEVRRRIQMVDKLLAIVSTNTTEGHYLAGARATLASRLPQ